MSQSLCQNKNWCIRTRCWCVVLFITIHIGHYLLRFQITPPLDAPEPEAEGFLFPHEPMGMWYDLPCLFRIFFSSWCTKARGHGFIVSYGYVICGHCNVLQWTINLFHLGYIYIYIYIIYIEFQKHIVLISLQFWILSIYIYKPFHHDYDAVLCIESMLKLTFINISIHIQPSTIYCICMVVL